MNLGKFYYGVYELNTYYEDLGILAQIDKLINAVSSYIGSPSADTIQVFRDTTNETLQLVSSYNPEMNLESLREVLKETNGTDSFGPGLEKALREIVTNSGLVPQELLSSIQKLRKRVSMFSQHIKNVSNAFEVFGTDYNFIEEDHFEFGALLPKELVGESIEEINKELLHLDRLFKNLNELMGYGNTSPKVKTISSSWWQFFIELDATQIMAVTIAIERIVNLYKTSLEIRKMKAEAEEKKLSAKAIEVLEQEIETKIKTGMHEIAKEIREKFQKNDDKSRCNELEIGIRQELINLAKRINQGAVYEVRAGLPEEPDAVAEGQDGFDEYLVNLENYQNKLKISNEINERSNEIIKICNGTNSEETLLLTDYDKLNQDSNENKK